MGNCSNIKRLRLDFKRIEYSGFDFEYFKIRLLERIRGEFLFRLEMMLAVYKRNELKGRGGYEILDLSLIFEVFLQNQPELEVLSFYQGYYQDQHDSQVVKYLRDDLRAKSSSVKFLKIRDRVVVNEDIKPQLRL